MLPEKTFAFSSTHDNENPLFPPFQIREDILLQGGGDWTNVIIPGDPRSSGFNHRQSYEVTGLRQDAEYECLVQARNRFGWSEASRIFHFFSGKRGDQRTMERIASLFCRRPPPPSAKVVVKTSFLSQFISPLRNRPLPLSALIQPKRRSVVATDAQKRKAGQKRGGTVSFFSFYASTDFTNNMNLFLKM